MKGALLLSYDKEPPSCREEMDPMDAEAPRDTDNARIVANFNVNECMAMM